MPEPRFISNIEELKRIVQLSREQEDSFERAIEKAIAREK